MSAGVVIDDGDCGLLLVIDGGTGAVLSIVKVELPALVWTLPAASVAYVRTV